LKILVASVAVLIVIPLFLGILFELVVVIPLRVPFDQTALLYVWQVYYIVTFVATRSNVAGAVK